MRAGTPSPLLSSFALVSAVLAAACSAPTATGPAATPSQSTGTSHEQTTTPPPTTPAAGPGIGEHCASDHTCGAGLECVGYYGIAGARGPKFESCEKRCDAKSACPDGRACTTIADGPGQVCR